MAFQYDEVGQRWEWVPDTQPPTSTPTGLSEPFAPAGPVAPASSPAQSPATFTDEQRKRFFSTSGLGRSFMEAQGLTYIPADEGSPDYWSPIGYKGTDEEGLIDTEATAAQAQALMAGGVPQEFADQYWTDRMYETVGNVVSQWGEQYADAAMRAAQAERRFTENPNDRQAYLDHAAAWQEIPMRDAGNLWSGSGGIVQLTGGMLRTLATNPAVMAALTAGLATPAVAGGTAVLTPVQAAATTGALQGAATGDNPFVGALRGAAIGGLTAGAGQFAGSQAAGMFPESPWVAGLARGAATGATGAALTGGDILQAGAVGGITGGLSGLGQPVPQAAPQPSPSDVEFEQIMADVDGLLATIPGGLDVEGLDPTGQSMMIAPAGQRPGASPMQPMMMASTPEDQMLLQQTLEQQGVTGPTMSDFLAQASPELQTTLSGLSTEPAPMPTVDSEEEEQQTEITSEGLTRFAKKAIDILSQALGDRAVPQFVLPEQEEGQSDEEYYTAVGEAAIEYMGLDPDDMRERGLIPGTQAYLDYILTQADTLIADIFGDYPSALLEGESVADLQAAFRNLSEQEAQQLARALHVRGALGSLTFASAATDPFTGISEELGMLPGEKVSGAESARQRGLARSLETLAFQPASQARETLGGMLGRDVDLYGMQANADARRLAAELAEQITEEKKKRGEKFDQNSPDFWREILDRLEDRAPGSIESLLRTPT